MRIVLLTPSYRPTFAGGGAYATAIAEGLARRRHEVHVITPRMRVDTAWGPATPDHGREMVAEVRVWRLEPQSGLSRAIERLGRLRGGWRVSRALLRFPGIRARAGRHWADRAMPRLQALAPALVTVMDWSMLPPVRAVAALRGTLDCPLVGIPIFHTQEDWVQARHYDALFLCYDALVVSTEHEKGFVDARLADAAPGRRPALHVVGLGVDPVAFARPDGVGMRARLGLGADPVVGFVGRLDPSKGVVGVIAAMETVWRARPEARLLLAGRRFARGSPRDGEIQAALDRVPARFRDRVVVVDGFSDAEKTSIFEAMDVLAMPSLADSFGLVYLEAWMCGKPVIGANVGATPSVIRDGEDGLLVDPRDPKSIAGAILALLADPDRRARMGRAGYERTVAERTWERVTEAVESVYAGLADARRRRAMLPPP
jgi:glycosyltransferase involved in cell wall biosynthesis